MREYEGVKSFGYKITDVNARIGCLDAYGKQVDIKELLRIMDFYSIDHAVCTDEYYVINPQVANIQMKKASESTNGRVGVCAYLDSSLGADSLPGEGTLAERLKSFGAEAARILVIPGRSTFTAFYWGEILDAVNAVGLPLIIDGEYSDAFYTVLPETAEKYPDIKFILVRQGLCLNRLIMPMIKQLKNVYFTTEYMLDNYQIEEIVAAGGIEKLLFATCYPEKVPAGALGLALFAVISEEDKKKLLSENWEGIRG